MVSYADSLKEPNHLMAICLVALVCRSRSGSDPSVDRNCSRSEQDRLFPILGWKWDEHPEILRTTPKGGISSSEPPMQTKVRLNLGVMGLVHKPTIVSWSAPLRCPSWERCTE